MKKNGFTLIELLVVIAIIAILSVVVIPSVITVNKNVNERLYNQKVENIESAAELYASNNPDIFNGADRVYVFVYQLIDANYLEIDTKYSTGDCKSADGTDVSVYEKGCITDPRAEDVNGNPINNNILNKQQVLLVKKNVGVTATIVDNRQNTTNSGSATLTQIVCDRFKNSTYLGMYSSSSDGYCKCSDNYQDLVTYTVSEDASGNKVETVTGSTNICMIVSNKESGDVDNWLKYGSTQANWRVLGLYKINGQIYPKMITSDVVQ